MKRTSLKFVAPVLAGLMAVASCACLKHGESKDRAVTIGISWCSDTTSEFYTNIVKTVREAGADPVLMPQVVNVNIPCADGYVSSECIDSNGFLTERYAEMLKRNPSAGSNVREVLEGMDAVIFTGGEDISPTLFAAPQPWHGIGEERDYNATRDVNDYILMSYCIEQDISVIGFCRGMQMLGAASGADIIQDIPSYFAGKGQDYDYLHRNRKAGNGYRDYSPHSVTVSRGSALYRISGRTATLEGVPSWHHQVLGSVEGTQLSVTGFTPTNGENFIEAIERRDRTLVIGLQFHPEAAVVKYDTGAWNAGDFLDRDQALGIFRNFIKMVKERGRRD